MLTDPIADFLTRLRNANRSRRGYVIVRASNMIRAITKLLTEKQFVERFEESTDGKITNITIFFKLDREPVEFKRVSKPGQRIYVNHTGVKRVKNGLGMAVVSTSKGIMSGEDARKQKVGGEYVCEVY